jgi:hypothetical protein
MPCAAATRLVYLPRGVQRFSCIAAPPQSLKRRSEQTASLCSKAFLSAKAGRSDARRLGDEKRRRRQILRGIGAMWTAVSNLKPLIFT